MLPARKDQDGWMTTERTRQHLSALDTQTNAPVLDRRQRCLRDATKFGQLILAEALEFADDTNRFPRRDVDTLFRGTELAHLCSPIIMCSDGDDLEEHLSGKDAVDDAVLQPKPGGAVAFPLARQGLVMEPRDLS